VAKNNFLLHIIHSSQISANDPLNIPNAYARSLFLLSPVMASPIFWVVDFSSWGWTAEVMLQDQWKFKGILWYGEE